jgi:hypothetical protein
MSGRLGAGVQRISAGEELIVVRPEPVIDRLFADFDADATPEEDAIDLDGRIPRFDTRPAVARQHSIVAHEREASDLALLDRRDEKAVLDELFAELDEASQWY